VKSLLHAVFLFLLLWIGAGPACPVVTLWDVMVYVACKNQLPIVQTALLKQEYEEAQ